MTDDNMTIEERFHKTLVYLYQMLKTPLPNSVHREYINEVLHDCGFDKEQ